MMTDRPVYAAFRLIGRQNLLDPSNDPNIGSARDDGEDSNREGILNDLGIDTSTSASALLSTFLPAFILFTLWVTLFILCRRSQRRFYAPRSYLGNIHEHERSPQLPAGFFNWFRAFFGLSDTYVLQHSSLDGYFFLRFLRLMSVICLVGCILIWPILLPIHATGGAGNTQLDSLSFSNVTNPKMYYAHTFVSWLFFGFVFYMVTRESIFYASLRQAYLISPMNASRISSRTVLFMSVPTSYLTKEKLAEVFGDAVKRIWITSDCKKLDKLVRKRDKLAFRLEELEATYVKSANAARLKSMKSNDQEAALDPTSAHWSRGVKRPTHRLQFLKRKKVDSIDWVRGQLETLIPKVSIMQMKHRIGEAKAIPAVFIEFNTQTDAQIAYQTLSHHAPFQMTPRYIGVPPNQIIWSSLRYSWWEKIVRKFLIQGFIVVLIVFWSIPSAFVGTISNIAYLTDLLPPLRFINDLPTVIKGTISGLLPAAGLALLMSLVPVILRFCARHTGLPSMARVELFTQNAHFAFQVVQVFLVTTITSAASAALDQIIKDPLSAKDILAENLPKSSNFYISYFVLQGLVLSAGAVVQVFGFIIFKILRIFLDTTPRKLYNRWVELSGLSWGTVFPVFTNMAVIAITYSCIAPLILGFSSLGLYLVYQAYRYNLLFVYDNTVDTMGLVYPRALQQVLTGIYLAEICMIGLFAIRAAIGPLILMGIFTLVSILAHISLNEALSPLLSALPRTLDKPDTNSGERDDQKEPSELRRRKPALFDEPPIDEIGKEAAFEKETTVSYATPSRSSSGISSASATAASSGSWPKLRKFFAFFLHPGDYALLRKKVGQYAVVNYPDDIAENAYYPPSVSRPTPLLWIPRDAGGISALEIEATKRVIPITDEEAHLDEKNKVVWDKVRLRPPIWEEKIFY